MSSKTKSDLTRASQVYIRGVVCSTRGIALRVTFSTFRAQKKILWEQSKRLISGSLVVLTPAEDMFKSKTIVATVAARQLATLNADPPEIDLFIARAEELEIDPAMKFVMIEERSAYFEAHKHTLLALQKMALERFPLSEHLVGAQPLVSAPQHLINNPYMDLTSVFNNNRNETYENIDVLTGWPTQPQSDLDQSQTAAMHRILTKSLAIVQGPPGTGKTFVSVQALRIMLANLKRGDPPIIVACQTNHALDQLLRHIATFEKDFIRMGSRSKDRDVIKKRTLYEVRNSTSNNALPGSVGPGAKKKMKDLEKEIAEIIAPLRADEKSLLDHRLLEQLGLLTSKQADSLESGASKWVQQSLGNPKQVARSPMKSWLDRSLEDVPRPGESQDFGFDLEDADLEYEQLLEIEAENLAKDDEEFDGLIGNIYAIADHYTGRKRPGMATEKLKISLEQQDMWKISENIRGDVYRHLQEAAKRCLRDKLREKVKAYDAQSRLRRVGDWERDETILCEQKIIGMTTTGLSKYRGLIAALQPKVILVEEAAETLEAPVTAACVPSLQQLVLVGDHQQLRPHCNVSAHEGSPFHLDISLFERMVKNTVEYDILNRQRRMIPEIRRLLRPIYGNKIHDHGSVLIPANRPNVPGMGGVNSFFFSHQWPETRDEQMSCINTDEAVMIVGFVEYLFFNGLDTEDITILTFYNGQRKCLLASLRKSQILADRHFNVVTVDSYQGEENKVVILSLVRSNDRNQIGFLGIVNRVCVALSRAQCGFYMFGNGMLLYKTMIWEAVIDIIAGNKSKKDRPAILPNRLAEKLPLRCKNHNALTEISNSGDWEGLKGGCTQQCKATLSCGHPCTYTCHPFSHDFVRCHYDCKTILECGHPCIVLCGEPCVCRLCPKTTEPPKITATPPPQSSSRSSQSWQSFAKEEPTRYAAAGSMSSSSHSTSHAPVTTHTAAGSSSSRSTSRSPATPHPAAGLSTVHAGSRASPATATAAEPRLVEIDGDDEDEQFAHAISPIRLNESGSGRRAQKRSGESSGGVHILDL